MRQAAVVTATGAGEPALVAYIVPRRGSAVALPGTDLLEELRPHLRATLPDYMVPALVVALPALPLTATRFVARVADTYGVSLPVHHVFTGPTIAELAEIVSADPDFGLAAGPSRHAELDELSHEDMDDLLRAALARRNRRQAIPGGPDS